jgi:hypothetical protein
VAAQLADSQEGLSSMKLVSYLDSLVFIYIRFGWPEVDKVTASL